MTDKRKEPRKKFRKLIKIDGMSCKIEDISESGLSVVMPKKPNSQKVLINFGNFECEGVVKWILTNRYGQPPSVGIKFTDCVKEELFELLSTQKL